MLGAVALVHALGLMGLVTAGGGTPAAAGQALPAPPTTTMTVRAVLAPVAQPALLTPPAEAAEPKSPPADLPVARPAPRPAPPDAALARDDTPADVTPAPTAPLSSPTPPNGAAAAAVESVPAFPPPSPEPLLVAAAATAAPAAAAAPPLPRYRASLPPPFEAQFDMRRGALSGQASWRYSTSDGGRYRLELETTILGQNISHLRSEGGSSRAGLEPLRFVDGRRGRDRRSVNFQRDAAGGARISFSGPTHELPLPEGVQDRLSWLLQLAAIVDADPSLRQGGTRVSMWVVSPRGDADVWTFEILGADTLRGGDGRPQPALALQRKADRQLDTDVRVWLDPAARHLPLRAVWRHDGEGPAVELRRESLAWR